MTFSSLACLFNTAIFQFMGGNTLRYGALNLLRLPAEKTLTCDVMSFAHLVLALSLLTIAPPAWALNADEAYAQCDGAKSAALAWLYGGNNPNVECSPCVVFCEPRLQAGAYNSCSDYGYGGRALRYCGHRNGIWVCDSLYACYSADRSCSSGILQSDGTCSHKDFGEPSCGKDISNPCNAATGNKYQAEVDQISVTDGIPFVRYYNSQLTQDVNFGLGWTSSILGRNLNLNPTNLSTIVHVQRANGHGEPFTCTTTCQGDSDTRFQLTADSSGFTLTLRDTSVERYDPTGKLLTETDSSGKITSYDYDTTGKLTTVTDSFGHVLALGYNASNHISSVTDSANKVISYTYDPNNNLVRVDYPDATAKLYHYENTSFLNNLTGISNVDALGATTRYSTYAYDVNGKAILTQHAVTTNGAPQEKFTLAYDVPAANQTTVTDPLNMSDVLTFSTNLGVKNLVNKVNQSDLSNPAACNVGGTGRVTTYEYLSPTLDLVRFIRRPSVAVGQTFETELVYADTSHPNLPTQIIQRGFTP
ncbi:MAG: RHS repeat protein, partial [Gammaproteobacteria bacterium]|nr:RHS repeat protein [Gammaproteobacteria bacterium]